MHGAPAAYIGQFACILLTNLGAHVFTWTPECDLDDIKPLGETVEVFTFQGDREVIETGRPTF